MGITKTRAMLGFTALSLQNSPLEKVVSCLALCVWSFALAHAPTCKRSENCVPMQLSTLACSDQTKGEKFMKQILFIMALILILAIQVSWAQIPETMGYQGLLTNADGTAVDDGSYILTFNIYSLEFGIGELWTETHDAVAVKNGLFNVILGSENPLDIPFDQGYWLGIKVGSGNELEPRIQLTSAAYSLNSRSVADGAVTRSKIASGQVVKSLNLLKDDVTLTAGNNITITPSGNTLNIAATGGVGAWSLTGNVGTSPPANFLGTTDNSPLALHVFGARALLIEPHSTCPNIIGGYSGNSVSSGILGAAIGGGGSSGDPNLVKDNFGTVSGGAKNQAGNDTAISGECATVGGGYDNTASRDHSTVGGGYSSIADGRAATVSGGWINQANADYTSVGGGIGNVAGEQCATIGGGSENEASGVHSIVGGGKSNTASGLFAVIGGGWGNQAAGHYATIAGGGMVNYLTPGTNNRATDDYSTVGGGGGNQAGNGDASTIDAPYATIGGGLSNTADGINSTIGGGWSNQAGGSYAFIGGGVSNTASAANTSIGGGLGNNASANYATIAGGRNNQASGEYAFIGGGGDDNPVASNRVTDDYGTVGGGQQNQAGDDAGTTEDATHDTVGGGFNNHATGYYTTVGGGCNNIASDYYSTVGGGFANHATGFMAAVPGGGFNTADGIYSFAAGHRAKADGDGAFAWGDNNEFDVHAWNANEFVVRATGGLWLITGINASGNPVEGMRLPAGQSAWVPIGSTTSSASAQLSQVSQEQIDQIQTLEAENTTLKQRVDDLEARLKALEALLR